MHSGKSSVFVKNVPVVIVSSAFGAEAIRRDGHAAWAAIAAKAGAAGFEVRRELFANDAQASPEALRELGDAIRATGLWAVYSTPAMLFDATGALDTQALTRTLAESDALGARIVKFQLGGTAENGTATDEATLARLVDGIRASTAKVVVENGQLKAGGTIDAFAALFKALSTKRHALSMTFDTGNWLWAEQDPMTAAARLGQCVGYVHCKAVQGEGARRYASAPQPGDAFFTALLAALPADVPRGIEFPFDPAHPADDAARYVRQLASA